MSKDNKNKDQKNESNLVKSTTNDQIETNDLKLVSVDMSCNDCKYNPQNISKRERFFNIFGVQPNEEFYIKGENEKSPYLIYHFTDQVNLLARSSNDKEGIMSWCSLISYDKFLQDDVELVKL